MSEVVEQCAFIDVGVELGPRPLVHAVVKVLRLNKVGVRVRYICIYAGRNDIKITINKY